MEMDSKGLSLKARLIGGFGLLLLVIVVISAIAFNSIQTAQTMVEQLTKSQMVQQQRMQEVANQANLIARVVRNIQIIGNATDKDAESAAREFPRMEAARDKIVQALEAMEVQAKQENDEATLKDIAQIREKRLPYVEAQKNLPKPLTPSAWICRAPSPLATCALRWWRISRQLKAACKTRSGNRSRSLAIWLRPSSRPPS
jgi:uncharacterized membrane protein YccC